MKFHQMRSINPDTHGEANAKSIATNALVLLTKIWQYLTAIFNPIISSIPHQTRHTPVSPQNRKVQNTKSLQGSKPIEPKQTYYKSHKLPKTNVLTTWRFCTISNPQENKKGDRQYQNLPPDPQKHHRQLATT